jgi:hypothetical protein
VKHGEVREGRIETGGIGDAPQEARNAQERFRGKGEEPQAGDRDRLERSSRERRQGPFAPFEQDLVKPFAEAFGDAVVEEPLAIVEQIAVSDYAA